MIVRAGTLAPDLITGHGVHVIPLIDVETVVAGSGRGDHHLPDALLNGLLEVEVDGEVAGPGQGGHGAHGVVGARQDVLRFRAG